jgi:hypothetical protein
VTRAFALQSSGNPQSSQAGRGSRSLVSDALALGLAIPRALDRLMGGDLSYRRTEPTEFILSLPIDSSRYQA